MWKNVKMLKWSGDHFIIYVNVESLCCIVAEYMGKKKKGTLEKQKKKYNLVLNE